MARKDWQSRRQNDFEEDWAKVREVNCESLFAQYIFLKAERLRSQICYFPPHLPIATQSAQSSN